LELEEFQELFVEFEEQLHLTQVQHYKVQQYPYQELQLS